MLDHDAAVLNTAEDFIAHALGGCLFPPIARVDGPIDRSVAQLRDDAQNTAIPCAKGHPHPGFAILAGGLLECSFRLEQL